MPRRPTASPSVAAPARPATGGPRAAGAERMSVDQRPARSAPRPSGEATGRRMSGYEQVLTFHGIGEPPVAVTEEESQVWIPEDWFEAILEAAAEPHVHLTFDDGNASDFQIAFPALVERGMTGRFFPLSGRTDSPGYLSAEQIVELDRAGMTIGSQGVHHEPWRTLGEEELRIDLMESRRALAELTGREVIEAACPFGAYDRRVLAALRAAGYTRVFNSDGGMCRAGAWLSARTTVSRELPLEHWVRLVSVDGSHRPGPVAIGKRIVKRLR